MDILHEVSESMGFTVSMTMAYDSTTILLVAKSGKPLRRAFTVKGVWQGGVESCILFNALMAMAASVTNSVYQYQPPITACEIREWCELDQVNSPSMSDDVRSDVVPL